MTDQPKPTELLPLVTEIIAAHLSSNKVPATELPDLIRQIYGALAEASTGETGPTPHGDPAVPIKKSVTPEFVICLECGKQASMLKRHIRTAHGMSIEEYRHRWELAANYPMVAPNYAKKRSRLAKQIGLGTQARRKRTEAARARKSAFRRASK
jgi:predicted transcriptional regulator